MSYVENHYYVPIKTRLTAVPARDSEVSNQKPRPSDRSTICTKRILCFRLRSSCVSGHRTPVWTTWAPRDELTRSGCECLRA